MKPHSWIRALAGLALAAGLCAPVLAQPGGWGFDVSGMDRSVRPGDDFYRFANGAWRSRTQIPGDRTMVGALADLRYGASDRVHAILDDPSLARAAPGSTPWKIAALKAAYLDEAAVEARGAAPLKADLDAVRRARTRGDLAELMGRGFGGFQAAIFDLDISYDSRDPTRYSLHLGQGGLGLPDRDYYLAPQFAGQDAAYQAYAARLLRLAGWPDPDGEARAVVAFETAIAEASWTHAQQRDLDAAYAPQGLAALQAAAPGFDWARFLDGAGLAGTKTIVVTTGSSLPRIAALYAATPIATLRAWQAFRTADAAAPYLSAPFAQASFDFHGRVLGGQAQAAPRAVRALAFVNDTMGSAVGQLYVARYFSAASQARMAELVANLRGALKARIQGLAWMSPATKAEALAKLANLEVQIGQPRTWVDYGALTVRPDDLYGDAERARAFAWRRRVGQLGGAWNKSDWRFWPQYATAYTENNQLIFTAAILQPPFFDAAADPAVNYGAIGQVIGHELTHSFDDQGRHEDAQGRLRDWWSADDAAHFEAEARRLSAQYSAMHPLPGLAIKGDVTLGENIADLGGLTIALDAYRASLDGRPAPVLDGFSGEQRVFLGFAQVWREKRTDDNLRQLLTTDLHSPGTARVDGVVRNLDGWYAAFGATPRDGMYLAPGDRVRIW
jgi:putative endopeptidase